MSKFLSKRGHNARVTGLAMLVFGIAIALAAGYGQADGLSSFSVLVAVAGFITFIVGIGLGRETPKDSPTDAPAEQ
ncbi:hypothetical protein [Glutamicibacter sp. AOP5-A2-18]|uniref:hypothetical protein n=1 Tax=Glutamicibacter sp. AOP5-A2-18 TaxID=3457656 RepID=UPI004034ABC5